MRMIIVRHGDPDYEKDSLTPKGWREAELLSDRIAALDVKAFYVSPLGRARDTAMLTLKKLNRTAEICPWLREFDAHIKNIHTGEERILWDWLPQDWTAVEEYYDRRMWCETEVMREGNAREYAERVYEGIDALIEKHGYKHSGNTFRVLNPNNDTIVLFCHFGVECLMLGYLLGISPMILWHGFCAAPTSVTTLYTEERRKGTAYFRVNGFGDISHLYAAGEPPAFAARFCEMFDNAEERHD